MKSLNLELINIDADGVAWVKTESGEFFGVVNAFEIKGGDGQFYPDLLAIDILELHCDINQNFETEANEIEFIAENGESGTLSITATSCELIDNN